MLPLEKPDCGFVIEITAVYFEKHVELISTLSGEMKFFRVKAGGIYNYPCAIIYFSMAVYRTSINGSVISVRIVKVCRRVEVLLHTFLPLALDGGELSASRLPQDLPLPVMHEAFSQARLMRGEISLVTLLGLEPRLVRL